MAAQGRDYQCLMFSHHGYLFSCCLRESNCGMHEIITAPIDTNDSKGKMNIAYQDHRCRLKISRSVDLQIILLKKLFIGFIGQQCLTTILAIPSLTSRRDVDDCENHMGDAMLYLLVFDFHKWMYLQLSADVIKNRRAGLRDWQIMLINEADSVRILILNKITQNLYSSRFVESLLKPIIDLDGETLDSSNSISWTRYNLRVSYVYDALRPFSSQETLCVYVRLATSVSMVDGENCSWIELTSSVAKELSVVTFPEVSKMYQPLLTAACVISIDGERYLAFTTSYYQLVLSSVSKTELKCFEIPFNDCRRILFEEVGLGGVVLLLINDDSKNMAVFHLNEKKISGQWSGYHYVFVDDFLGSGHNQVLVLFTDSLYCLCIHGHRTRTHFITPAYMTVCFKASLINSTNLREHVLFTFNFITEDPLKDKQLSYWVTDFACCSLESGTHKEDETEKQICTGYQDALDSLKSCSIRMSSDVADLQARNRDKEILIKETWSSLKGLIHPSSTVQDSSLFEDNLISVLGKESSQGQEEKEEVDKSSCPDIICKQVWQRILVDQWVIGAEIINTGKRPIFNLSLFPMMERMAIKSKLNFGIKSSNDTATETSLKKRKKEYRKTELNAGSSTTLVSLLNVPDLTEQDFVVTPVYVNYQRAPIEGEKGGMEYFDFLEEVTLRYEDFAKRKYMIPAEMKEREAVDWMAFENAMITIKATIDCRFGKAPEAVSWIRDTLQLRESHTCNSMNYLTNTDGLDLVVKSADNCAKLTFYGRNENVVLCAIRLIERSLPARFSFMCYEDRSIVTQKMEELISSMEDEITERMKINKAVNKLGYYNTATSELTPEESSDVSRFRLHIKRKREELRSSENAQDQGSNMLELHQKYLSAMATTDSIYQVMSQPFR